jgi:acetyl esterase/lipase
MIGGPDTHRGICASLAKRGVLEVCALDYRLAPEHPYPAARDDVVAAYQALLAAGYRAEQIAIGGDSAGGNLSLVGCLRIIELGLPAPAALVCFSPATDFTGELMHEPPAGDPLIHPSWIEQAADLYCPADLPRNDPGMSPVFADLSQLPPTLIQVGEDELLLNDSLRLAERAKAAGVNVRLERYRGCGTCSRRTSACCVRQITPLPAWRPFSGNGACDEQHPHQRCCIGHWRRHRATVSHTGLACRTARCR